MTGSISDYDQTVRQLENGNQKAEQGIDLESVVVRYEGQPDRCTIVPQECPEEKRLTTWLSANSSSFVELEESR